MECFNITIQIAGKTHSLEIKNVKTFYQVVHNGKVIAGLRPPGEDWQLMELEELPDEFSSFKGCSDSADQIRLTAPMVNEIAAAIESRENPPG